MLQLLQGLMEHPPGKQDVVSIICVKPGGEDREGLAALAEGRLEVEAAQAGSGGSHTGLSPIAMMHIKV